MIQVYKVFREPTGRILRLEILFDHHLHFVFFPNKKGEPELVAWDQIPNNSRYWLGKIWARAHAIFRFEPEAEAEAEAESEFESESESESESASVPVIESENSQLILKF